MEVAFIKAAGAGNAAEMKTGELALQDAASPEIKAFAQTMITDIWPPIEREVVAALGDDLR